MKIYSDENNGAYYKGKSDGYNGEIVLTRASFDTDEAFTNYKRGMKHALAEERLNNDEEWD